MEVDSRLTRGLVADQAESRISKGKVFVGLLVGKIKDFSNLIRRITPYRRNIR